MVNTHPSVSGIFARWTKPVAFLLILLLALPAGLQAQKLSDSDLRKFNELFFEAEKQKNLGNTAEAKELYEKLYKMSDENATVCFELAQIYGAEGQSEQAVFYAERAAELDPDNRWIKLLLGSVYRNFNRGEDEIRVFRELVSLDTTNPDYRYELALAYLNNNYSKKAIAHLDTLEQMIGINEIISDQKKQIYLEDGDLEGAVTEIQKLIDAYPKNIEYYGTLAQLYMANGFEEEAFEVYRQMLRIAPEDPRPHLDLAQYYQNKGQYDTSLFHLKAAMLSPEMGIDQKIPVLLSLFQVAGQDSNIRKETYDILAAMSEQNPNDPKAFAIYGDFLSRDGRDREALENYKKAVALEGGNRFEIWEQILLIEIQGEMYDSLVKDGPAAIELFPNQPLPYLFTGVAFTMKDEWQEAAAYLEDGLNYVIANPRLKEQFYSQLADIYHRMGENRKSDDYFEKALTLNSKNPTVLNNYAYYLAVRGQNLEKALEMTEKSNSLSPNNPVFLDTWAWVLYKKGSYSEALSKMEQVIRLGGGQSGEVLEHYGDILFKAGKKDEALQQWKKAKESGETSEWIDQKIKTGEIVE